MESIASTSRFRWTKKHLLLAAGIGILFVALVIAARQTGLRQALDAMILALRDAGPLVFFGAMALLPAVGFPMIAFTLAAGPVFGPVLGTGWVIGWSLLAVAVNLLLTYWLANRALRPLVSRLLKYFDIHLPDGTTGGAWQITLIVRLTPGPPFWVQSYLLGLLRVPVGPYLVVSLLVMAGYIVALVCGGEAIAGGNGRLAFLAGGLLVVTVAVLQLLRQRTARRRAAAALVLGSPGILPAE
ncbi:MAG: VTT domain-containing protein [Lacunisphaera sp.]|nr:VTT domain-containing protein [Lacunisphaera sp.]